MYAKCRRVYQRENGISSDLLRDGDVDGEGEKKYTNNTSVYGGARKRKIGRRSREKRVSVLFESYFELKLPRKRVAKFNFTRLQIDPALGRTAPGIKYRYHKSYT